MLRLASLLGGSDSDALAKDLSISLEQVLEVMGGDGGKDMV